MSKQSSLFPKNYQPVYRRRRAGVTLDFNPDVLPSMTEQHHEPSVNLNTLYAKYVSKGLPMPNLRSDAGKSIASDEFDFMNIQNDIISAKRKFEAFSSHFDALASHVRKSFNNNPENWLIHLSKPGMIEEAIELGYISSSIAEQALPAQKVAKQRGSAGDAGSNPPKGGEEQGA